PEQRGTESDAQTAAVRERISRALDRNAQISFELRESCLEGAHCDRGNGLLLDCHPVHKAVRRLCFDLVAQGVHSERNRNRPCHRRSVSKTSLVICLPTPPPSGSAFSPKCRFPMTCIWAVDVFTP